MIEAGITNPESLEGIRFCTNKCPYDHCVIAEPKVSSRKVRALLQKRAARLLYSQGMSVQEIADKLEISLSSAKGYIPARRR